MRQYSPRWLIIIFAAIIFHLLAGLILAFALPKILPEKISEMEELAWLDVDLAGDSAEVSEENLPLEELAPEPEFQPFVMPELVVPETIFEPLPELPHYEPKPIEKPAPVQAPPAPKIESEKPAPPPEPPKMKEPPKTLKEFYPAENLGYKGFVTVRVRIGTDGNILYADIIAPSSRDEIDALALECARKWKFAPALDQHGSPMACDKIITFDFSKIG